MTFKIGDTVVLKSFLGLEIAPLNVKTRENYWRVVGYSGTVAGGEGEYKIPRHKNGERLLVKFNCDLNEMGLESHNEIDNSLWIFVTDLAIH
jgi:hypothetical protein